VRRQTWLSLGLVGIVAAVYGGSLHGPWVFDDWASIPHNLTIRHWATALRPPGGGVTVTGRPMLNLSFALNYAFSGDRVEFFHATNVGVHLLAALALFGLVRRLGATDWAAGVIAALWAVHPLQTESVTYTVQRAESLAGLFYLLTAYWFVRGRYGLCIAACSLGMATKETVATAPVFLLFLDRTFMAGSFREAWRLRSRIYGWLAATWLILAGLVAAGANRGGTAGVGLGLHASLIYAANQFPAIVRYVGLSFWPHPLIFDYGTDWGHVSWTTWPCAAAVLGLVGASVLALRRHPIPAFLGISFLLLLAPSSSVVPIATEQMAEHRMYLPLAALIAAAVLLAGRWIKARSGALKSASVRGMPESPEGFRYPQRSGALPSASVRGLLESPEGFRYPQRSGALKSASVRGLPESPEAFRNPQRSGALKSASKIPQWLAASLTAALILSAGTATVLRNRLYQNPIALWRDTVHHRPANASAHLNLGYLLYSAAQYQDAITELDAAVALDPENAKALTNRGRCQLALQRPTAAQADFAAAVRADPAYAEAHNNLGVTLAMAGRPAQARAEFQAALRLHPGYAEAQRNLERLGGPGAP
jgi:tetratricopeptide (TPR) repeat protein